MITKNEEYVLGVALANERIASEIVARVIDATPADAAAAQAILDVITPSEKESKQIEEYLIIALTNRAAGKEVAKLLDLIVKCLEYQAADDIANNAALNAAQAEISAIMDDFLGSALFERFAIACANKKIALDIWAKIYQAGGHCLTIPDAV